MTASAHATRWPRLPEQLLVVGAMHDGRCVLACGEQLFTCAPELLDHLVGTPPAAVVPVTPQMTLSVEPNVESRARAKARGVERVPFAQARRPAPEPTDEAPSPPTSPVRERAGGRAETVDYTRARALFNGGRGENLTAIAKLVGCCNASLYVRAKADDWWSDGWPAGENGRHLQKKPKAAPKPRAPRPRLVRALNANQRPRIDYVRARAMYDGGRGRSLADIATELQCSDQSLYNRARDEHWRADGWPAGEEAAPRARRAGSRAPAAPVSRPRTTPPPKDEQIVRAMEKEADRDLQVLRTQKKPRPPATSTLAQFNTPAPAKPVKPPKPVVATGARRGPLDGLDRRCHHCGRRTPHDPCWNCLEFSS